MPKRLAEIVVETALATREDVIQAARLADQNKVPLVVPLVREIGVDELALVATIKRHRRVSLPDPATVTHDPEAIREVARDICWRLRAIPLSISYPSSDIKALRVAMADPTDTVAIAELEHVTGCQVTPSLMPLSAIEELIEKAYKSFVTDVFRRPKKKRVPFGGDLEVTTKPIPRPDAQAGAPVEAAEPMKTRPLAVGALALDEDEDTSKGPAPEKPSTVPFHRVADEADLELRLQALLELLIEKDLLSMQEFDQHVRTLMKRRDESS